MNYKIGLQFYNMIEIVNHNLTIMIWPLIERFNRKAISDFGFRTKIYIIDIFPYSILINEL